jgi:ribosome recycling factor
MKPAEASKSAREVEASVKARMDKVMSDLQHAMATIRTGRASISLLDGVRVDYYGTPTPLSQVATLHVPEPAMITAQPWDVSQIGAIEKAICSSDLGLNSEQRRQDHSHSDPASLRGAPQATGQAPAHHHGGPPRRPTERAPRRQREHQEAVKDKSISEDEDRRSHDSIQKVTNDYIQKA